MSALTANALLNLNRWNYWTHDGKPREGTLEAIGILKSVLAPIRITPTHCICLFMRLRGDPTRRSPCRQPTDCGAWLRT